MATQPIDYTALAKQAGSISDTPPPAASAAGQPIDYAALAKQAGAISSTPPPAPSPPDNTAVLNEISTANNNRPLWRKFLGMPPDESTLSPAAQQYGAANRAAAGKQIADQLSGVYSGYGEGAKEAAKMAPFMILPGLAGMGARAALGSGALGTAADIGAQGLTSAGIAKAEGSSNAGTAAAGVLGAAGPAVETAAPAMSNALKGSAIAQYAKFLSPTKQATKYEATDVIPELLDRKIMATSGEGLASKAGSKMAEVGQDINQAVTNVPASVTPDVQGVLDAIDKQKANFLVSGVPPSANAQASVDALERAKDGILNVVTAPGSNVSFQSLNKARQILDKTVAQAGGYVGKSIADTSSLAADKAAANAIRSELASKSPDIATLNAEYHFWAQVKDVIDQTNARQVGNQGGIGRVLAPLAGGIGGLAHGGFSAQGGLEGFGAASAFLALNQALRSPAWRTFAAVGKNQIADALAAGQFGQVTTLLGRLGAGAVSSRSSAPPDKQ